MIIDNIQKKTKCDFVGCKNLAEFWFGDECDSRKRMCFCEECLKSIYMCYKAHTIPKSPQAPFKSKKI